MRIFTIQDPISETQKAVGRLVLLFYRMRKIAAQDSQRPNFGCLEMFGHYNL